MKAEISNPTRQRKLDHYLWYWKPPFGTKKSPLHFDRRHWWKRNRKDVSHDAALYELFRRHPAVGELQRIKAEIDERRRHPAVGELQRQTLRSSQETMDHQSVRHVANEIFGFCLRPWTKLSKEQQAKFQNSLKVTYPGKGRDLTKGVFDLTDGAKEWAESEKDVGGPSFEECLKDLVESYASDGRLILAIDTDFGSKKEADAALKQLAGIFYKHLRLTSKSVRAHESAWLKAIQDFESNFNLDQISLFKLGYPATFKKFIAHFEDVEARAEARAFRAWWLDKGKSQWAAEFKAENSSLDSSE